MDQDTISFIIFLAGTVLVVGLVIFLTLLVFWIYILTWDKNDVHQETHDSDSTEL